MRWPWRRQGAIEPRPMVSRAIMELQTAKEILAEVFHTRPGEVEEMIQRRLSFLGGVKNESAFPYIGGSKLSRRKHSRY